MGEFISFSVTAYFAIGITYILLAAVLGHQIAVIGCVGFVVLWFLLDGKLTHLTRFLFGT